MVGISASSLSVIFKTSVIFAFELAPGQRCQQAERRQGICILVREVRVQDLCHGLGRLAGPSTSFGQPGEIGMEFIMFGLHGFWNIEGHILFRWRLAQGRAGLRIRRLHAE